MSLASFEKSRTSGTAGLIEHVDNCKCRISHKDFITSRGTRNLPTYEIDASCHQNGISADSISMMWTIRF